MTNFDHFNYLVELGLFNKSRQNEVESLNNFGTSRVRIVREDECENMWENFLKIPLAQNDIVSCDTWAYQPN